MAAGLVGADPSAPRLLFVCTGNATRSVIGAALVRRDRPSWGTASAGTLAVPGQPLGASTRRAMALIGLDPPRDHRSAEVRAEDVAAADLVVGFERHHVAFLRRRWPQQAGRVALLSTWATRLPADERPLGDRVAALGLAAAAAPAPSAPGPAPLDPAQVDPEVDDPGGGTDTDYARSAVEIAAWLHRLLPRIGHTIR